MKQSLRWAGIVFAFAALLLLVTAADMLALRLGATPQGRFVATLVSASAAGALASLYSGRRGGMHSFLGALLGAPVLALFVLDGAWQSAVYLAAACTIAGAVVEIVIRQRTGA